jgi:hypothetical protein
LKKPGVSRALAKIRRGLSIDLDDPDDIRWRKLFYLEIFG